jgi:hypothetical protein
MGILGIGSFHAEVVTGWYKAVVDLSDVREVRDTMAEGGVERLNDHRAGVLPNTANTTRGPMASIISRTGLEG